MYQVDIKYSEQDICLKKIYSWTTKVKQNIYHHSETAQNQNTPTKKINVIFRI